MMAVANAATVRSIGKLVPWDKAVPLMLQRLWSRSAITERGCWEWQGHATEFGYGEAHFQGKRWRVHRLSYRIFKGEPDPKLDVCHACDNRRCWNPHHLWLGDPVANSEDCVQKGRHHMAARTHCPRGHSFAEFGRPHYTNAKWRLCSICEGDRYRREKSRAAPPRKKGICKRGHPIVGDNIYPKPGGRFQCRICHDAAVERRQAELKRLRHTSNESETQDLNK